MTITLPRLTVPRTTWWRVRSEPERQQWQRRIDAGRAWLAQAHSALRAAAYQNDLLPRSIARLSDALDAIAPPADAPLNEATAQAFDDLPGVVRKAGIEMAARGEICCSMGLNDFYRGAGIPPLTRRERERIM